MKDWCRKTKQRIHNKYILIWDKNTFHHLLSENYLSIQVFISTKIKKYTNILNQQRVQSSTTYNSDSRRFIIFDIQFKIEDTVDVYIHTHLTFNK